MRESLIEIMERSPVIATALSWDDVDAAVASECEIVLVAFGTVLELKEIVEKLKAAGKVVIIHLELIDGFSSREIAIDILMQNCTPDAIISTKAAHIRRGKQRRLYTILRMFMIDSKSYSQVSAQLKVNPDFIEIEPGIMPKVIRDLDREFHKPIIASGFITEKQEIISALSAGATAISTSTREIWDL